MKGIYSFEGTVLKEKTHLFISKDGTKVTLPYDTIKGKACKISNKKYYHDCTNKEFKYES